jgi:Mrp family chromosome partitioning ATPase
MSRARVHGAGPTGCLAALALAQVGWQVQLNDPLERAVLLRRQRAYALTHSSMGFLDRLGLGRAVAPHLVPFSSLELMDQGTGRQSHFSGADLGQRGLLVDADLRRSRLHRRLGVDNFRGLSELFAETPPQLEELFQWVQPNLAFLPAGPSLPDPARLLSSPRCAEIVAQIRDQQQFDLILFDTPPAMDLVDPLLIAEHTDGLMLLVSVGQIHRDLPAQVVRKVKESNLDLLGVVTNQRVEILTASGGDYNYAYGYASSYNRYSEGASKAPQSSPEDKSSLQKAAAAVLRSANSRLQGAKPTPASDDESQDRTQS